MLTVTFHGVRGSCAGPSAGASRYGANTAAVTVQARSGEEILLLDLGTGIRRIPIPVDSGLPITALATHLHFDHIQGLPFFPPVLDERVSLDIYAPHQEGTDVRDALAALIRPPYFPLTLDELPATIRCHDMDHGTFSVGRAEITARPVLHVGPTVGYRIEWDGASLAYVSDHQAPAAGGAVPQEVLELSNGVDLLIHDAQYTPEELAAKPTWGHSTPAFALDVARQAGARRLCLFHHDPDHDDDTLDAIAEEIGRMSEASGGPEVLAAAEGMTVQLP